MRTYLDTKQQIRHVRLHIDTCTCRLHKITCVCAMVLLFWVPIGTIGASQVLSGRGSLGEDKAVRVWE